MIEIEEMIGDMIGIGGMTEGHLDMIATGDMIGEAEEMTTIETMSEIRMVVEDQVKRMKKNPEYQNLRSMRSPNLKMLLPPTSLLSYKKRRPAVGAVRKIS